MIRSRTWVGEAPDPATLRVVAGAELIKPELERAAAAARDRFVGLTAATRAYGPLDETTTHPVHGVITVPLARACESSYSGAARDIHARTRGEKIIADLVVGTLPRREAR